MFNKITIIMIILILSLSTVFAQDSEVEEKKQFPGLLELEVKQTFQANTVGHRVGMGEFGEAAMGTLSELIGSMTFPITDFYYLSGWAHEELYFLYDTEIAKGVSNPFDDLSADNASNFKMENRFYTGLNNLFILPKDSLIIELNLVFRLKSELLKYVVTDSMGLDYSDSYTEYLTYVYMEKYYGIPNTMDEPEMENYGPATQLMFGTELNIGGEYDFGFSFMLENKFFMYMHPVMYYEAESPSSVVSDLEYNGIYTIAYNFLHKIDDFDLSIFACEDFDFGHKTSDYIIEDAEDTIFDNTRFDNWRADILSTLMVGVEFRAYDFTFFADYFMKHREYIDNCDDTGLNMWAGVQTGLQIIIKNWTFDIFYLGIYPVLEDGNIKEYQDWENTVQASISFKMDNM